ncbi:hypothetical protein D1P53_001929 [Cryptococcus gattii VGV]|nr:hypothetical protein D1P53_001929 [Cryptococcus gattii VGV]
MTLRKPIRRSDGNNSSPAQQQRHSSMPTTPAHFPTSSPHVHHPATSQYFTAPYQTMGRTAQLVSFNGPWHVRLYDVIGDGSVANDRVNLAPLPVQYAIDNSITSPEHHSISKSGLLPPASLSELRNRTQQAIERCGTVSRHNSLLSSLQTTRGCPRITTDNISYYMQADDQVVHRAMERFGMHDSSYTVAAQLSESYDEDTCAFVNFVKRSNAIFAHEDVLHRLGGILPTLSRTAPVLLGFGKTDASLKKKRSTTLASFLQGKMASEPYPTIPPNTPEMMKQGSASPLLATRAIKIVKVPIDVSSTKLSGTFSVFGSVENSRILPGKRHGFINFERLDSAVAAYEAFNGKKIFGAYHGRFRLILPEFPLELQVV